METNDYTMPLFRDSVFNEQKDAVESRLKVIQQLISAMKSLRDPPFRHYDILEKDVDEHPLQSLFWNFSCHVDFLCTVRDQIQAEHGNTLFSTRKARALHRHVRGETSLALDRVVSEPL